ncbi:hypothetical protein Goarm_000591, partial [Gossypium armourianum]|nr:hypothetical protein [Gossypium armourianum]
SISSFVIENDLASLSLKDEEEKILQAQKEPDSMVVEYQFCLVGCFLTASVIYFLTMRSTKDRVLNGALWTFNNHILMIYRLKDGDDPLKQEFGQGHAKLLTIRVRLDVRRSLKRKKKVMFSPGKCYYVDFKYKRLTFFCFFYGRLGHNDYFCQAKMDLGVEVAEMRWDLSLIAQSMRALAMDSGLLGAKGKRDSGTRIDPMVGLNLEGDLKLVLDMKWDTSKLQGQLDMNHDLEECAIVGGDEKKRPRRDSGSYNEGKASNLIVVRDRSLLERNHFLSAAAKGQTDRQINNVRMKGVRVRCGFSNGIEVATDGTIGGLCLAWKENVIINHISFSSCHVDDEVQENDEGKQWRFTGFYEALYAHNRDDLWNLLRNFGYFQQLQ